MTNFADNTGRIGDSDTFWGLETAALWGPFSAQAEYGHLDVDLPNGAFLRSNPPGSGLLAGAANPFVGIPDPSYSGWYVEGTWFFGGHRTWDKEGKFARPKIDNPMRWSEGAAGARCSWSASMTYSTRATTPSTMRSTPLRLSVPAAEVRISSADVRRPGFIPT